VVSGDVTLPLLAAIVVCAAAVGLLVAPRVDLGTVAPVTTVPLLAALALTLAANLVVLADLAEQRGFARAHGVVAGTVVALAVVVAPFAERWWRFAAPIGAAILMVPLALVIASNGAPWTVWRDVATRPALAFDAASPWVTQGGTIGDGDHLTFEEPHRVIAATPATWRIVERDRARLVVREWRLGAGDALTVRPGDQLVLDRGGRVRFEAGRRVPGAPASGMAWAAGGRASLRDASVALAGVAVTLVAGGIALAPAPSCIGLFAISTPALALLFVVAATLWGLYGLALAPELSLVPRALAPALEIVQRAQTPAWRAALETLVTAAIVVLFLGTIVAWRCRVVAAVQRHCASRLLLTAGPGALAVIAAGVAGRAGDPWQLFTWGLGLAAAAVVAPRLASAGPRGELVGMIAGTVAFAALLFAGTRMAPLADVARQYPALIAAPLAWLSARLARARA
jgi:hypothetical protein